MGNMICEKYMGICDSYLNNPKPTLHKPEMNPKPTQTKLETNPKPILNKQINPKQILDKPHANPTRTVNEP